MANLKQMKLKLGFEKKSKGTTAPLNKGLESIITILRDNKGAIFLPYKNPKGIEMFRLRSENGSPILNAKMSEILKLVEKGFLIKNDNCTFILNNKVI